MAQIDKLKEEIDWLKVVFAILIATDISLVAWVIQNYGKASRGLYSNWSNCSNSDYIYNYLAQ